jgi:pimeloyl-ACP methyl ester carboxylesterase
LSLNTTKVVFFPGWKESGARKKSILKEVLENIPGVSVVVVDYLDAPAKQTYFRSHLTIEEYAAKAEKVYLQIQKENPTAFIIVIGHSLGGVIARFLCKKGLFSSKNMILVGTPNLGISYKSFGGSLLGLLETPAFWILANKRLCNVPAFYQLYKGSSFLKKLNENGAPKEAHYIIGSMDQRVEPWSSDPHGIATVVNCDHHLIKFDGKDLDSLLMKDFDELDKTAVPVIVLIIRDNIPYADVVPKAMTV